MLTTVIKTIPHSEQRYPTVGDYFEHICRVEDCCAHALNEKNLQIRVSVMANPDHEFLVALHEFVESYLVRKRGISIESIDEFDKAFERLRIGRSEEPGDHPNAPYHQEHAFATTIERLVAKELGVDWKEYSLAVSYL